MIGTNGGVTLRLRRNPDDCTWDSLVAAHPAATAFHLSVFLRTVAPLLGQRAYLAVAEADGEVVGVVPLLLRDVGPFVLVNHQVGFPYLGPLLPPDVSLVAVLAAVRRHVRARPVVYFGLQSTNSFAVPSRPGWVCEELLSAIVETGDKDDDALLGLLSTSQRNKVRRDVRRGLEVGAATRQEVAGLTTLVNDTLARRGVPIQWSAGAHVRLYDALAPTGVCTVTAVRRDGELLAGSMNMLFGRRMIGWGMGLSEEGRTCGAAAVMATAVMRHARDSGADELDMLGAPTPGIAHYKRSLGAQLRPRGAAHWASPWLPRGRHLRPAAALLKRTVP